MNIQKYRDIEHYLGSKGYGFSGFGELAMHKGQQCSPKMQDRLVNFQDAKNVEYLQKREELRKEYKEKLKRGEIQEYTIIEKLIISANGHPDLEQTQAAKRVLRKRGIIN
jgi:hypothetical protein